MNKLLVPLILISLVAPAETLAEVVVVKYRSTPVNVANGHFEKIDLKQSSLVKKMYFDVKNQYLLVRLKHTFYHYCGIPKNKIEGWTASSSLGRYYLRHIKENYDCRIFPVPEY